jgi:hypothetical protein
VHRTSALFAALLAAAVLVGCTSEGSDSRTHEPAQQASAAPSAPPNPAIQSLIKPADATWTNTLKIPRLLHNRATVPRWGWVKLLRPASNNSVSFAKGEDCGIDFMGKLVADGSRGSSLTVAYFPPRAAYGASCPRGAIVGISTDDFPTMTARAAAMAREHNRQLSAVRSLYRKDESTQQFNFTGKPVGAPTLPEHRWVRVMNPYPIESVNVTRGFWSTCSINDRGRVQVVGTLGGQPLAVFYTGVHRAGAECPSGTLFMLANQRDDLPTIN